MKFLHFSIHFVCLLFVQVKDKTYTNHLKCVAKYRNHVTYIVDTGNCFRSLNYVLAGYIPYKAKAGCLKGIESIRRNAAESPVVEEKA